MALWVPQRFFDDLIFFEKMLADVGISREFCCDVAHRFMAIEGYAVSQLRNDDY